MQELFGKKKEPVQVPVHTEPVKKQPPVAHAAQISMSEGPMQLRDEGVKIERAGRLSFEKSVEIELAALKARLARRKKARAAKAKGKKQKDDSQKPPKK
ncbi:MAG: hypothetical protein NT051_01310 [Candidatus Micrarchaeota archaeon]|nr:hypothetical protein [Candidatus Micrarchaeota archaeon]